MYLVNVHEEGGVATADVAMKSGQIVIWTKKSDDKLHAVLVTGSGDEGKKLGIAYVDPSRKNYMQYGEGQRNTDPNVTELIAAGEVIAFIHSRFRGMNNQLNDGTYGPGDELTVDFTTARFKKATGGDVVYGRVQANSTTIKVLNQDNLVPIMGCLPEAL